jgi:hypothetical protein
MLTEIKLNKKQEHALLDLKDGMLLISYNDGEMIFAQTTGSDTIYYWNDHRWIPYRKSIGDIKRR